MLLMTVHGRLGRDAELRYTPDGKAVCELAIASNYGPKDNEGKRATQWIRGSLWGKQAESLAEYLTKGKGVVVAMDEVHVREWKDRNGAVGHSLEGRVLSFEFAQGAPREDGQAAAPRQASAQRQPPRPRASAASANPPDFDQQGDDDIPF